MRKSMFVLALAVALTAGACAQDVTASDEYQALELEVAAVEQQLSDTTAELAEAQARLEESSCETAGATEIPAEVLALLDEWWEVNERNDGSVVDLYTPDGYHLCGETKYALDTLAAHLQQAVNPKWIQPFSGCSAATRRPHDNRSEAAIYSRLSPRKVT